jgi:NTE family protein
MRIGSLVIVLTLMLAGCSTARPWLNAPLQPGEIVQYDGRRQIADSTRAGDILVVASFSGGGSRAAAFAHATLAEMDLHPFFWNGRRTTLAQEVDMVAGVSGGSVAAAHIALHGITAHLQRFPAEFLQVDFQGKLLGAALSPSKLYQMTSRWQGRGHMLADAFDAQLFHGTTFGQLAEMAGRPYLIVGATDLSNGSEFDFASDQFSSLCSSIDYVPLSFAVASSSSVPLLFSPLTLQNHSDSCPAPPGAPQRIASPTARAQLVQSEADSLAQPGRRYLHLVDGAVSDNLGLRRIADYVAQAGGIRAVLQLLQVDATQPEAIPRRIVFLSVNSERQAPSALEESDDVPGAVAVLGALVQGNLGRHSRETEFVFNEAIDQWRAELQVGGADVDVYLIEVNLSDLADAALRDRVLAIPTAFRISDADRESLVLAARESLTDSREFRRFMQSVAVGTTSSGAVDVEPPY